MQKQTLWGTVLFTLLVLTVMSIFVMIALQMNTLNTLDRQEKTLTAISEQQKERPKIVIQGTIPLDDSDDETDKSDTETSNDSTIAVEELETFVEYDDIVVEEKIVIHNDNEVAENKVVERKVGDNIILPDVPTNTFRCEPYLVYIKKMKKWVSAFDSSSDPYKLQQMCLTDETTGIRYYTDKNGKKWYCAALAGAFGIMAGSKYEFTLANGTVVPVILADYKHDISNVRPDDYGDDDINYDGEYCINVIEFVVDIRVIPRNVLSAGTMSALKEYGGLYGHEGNIVDIVYCGRDTNFLN